MKLFRQYLKKCKKMADKNRMRITVLGDPTAFDEDIQESIREVQEYSAQYNEHFFQIALNYGSRDEIKRAVNKIADDVRAGKMQREKISEDMIASYLDTAGLPDPDLLIRTSGEQRLSNYLLWQLAYTEFVFYRRSRGRHFHEGGTDGCNPSSIITRDRRYGGVRSNMFKTRLISGIVLVLIALLTICSGGISVCL